jgi:hypothetical protein
MSIKKMAHRKIKLKGGYHRVQGRTKTSSDVYMYMVSGIIRNQSFRRCKSLFIYCILTLSIINFVYTIKN